MKRSSMPWSHRIGRNCLKYACSRECLCAQRENGRNLESTLSEACNCMILSMLGNGFPLNLERLCTSTGYFSCKEENKVTLNEHGLNLMMPSKSTKGYMRKGGLRKY